MGPFETIWYNFDHLDHLRHFGLFEPSYYSFYIFLYLYSNPLIHYQFSIIKNILTINRYPLSAKVRFCQPPPLKHFRHLLIYTFRHFYLLEISLVIKLSSYYAECNQ